MKILIVEDDVYKLKDIQLFIRELYPQSDIDTTISYAGAVERCYSVMYQLLILDMNIPKYEKEDQDRSIADHGGEMIIREMVSEGIRTKFVIVTQYETIGNESINTLDERMQAFCPDIYCGYVSYASNNENWKQQLKYILNQNIYAENSDN